jgi:hypothetical protein
MGKTLAKRQWSGPGLNLTRPEPHQDLNLTRSGDRPLAPIVAENTANKARIRDGTGPAQRGL